MKRHNQRGRLIFALLLALLLPILVACGSGQPAANAPESTQAPAAAPATAAPESPPTTGSGKLRIAASLGTWPDTIAPQKSSFSNEIAVLLLNYEGLTRFDKDLKTVPAAAEKWDYNQDATQITFHLRDGLKYSDGSPLTAQAFVNAVYRTLDPHSPGDYQTSLSMIRGADAIINTAVPTDEAKLPDLNKALGVKATDDKTIVFDLTKPTPYFHTLAGIWVMFPAKQELIDKGGEQWYEDAANQIGNGPFQIAKIDKASNLIDFKANENYWAGKPKLDTVEFTYIQDLSVALQAYKSNEVDIIVPDPNDVPTIKADSVLGQEYKEYAGACTRTITFNLTKPPFDNQKVREAFAYAFDREGYVRDALKDTDIPTLTWIPTGYPGNDPSETRYKLDPAKAKQLLAEAGYPDGQGLPEIKYAYGSNNPANQPRAEYIVQMYQRNLGVSIIPDPIENTTLVNMRKDVATFPQVTTGGWCADYPDPQNWLSIYWHSSTSIAKNTGYKNAEVDKLLEQADIEVNATKRAQLYEQAQKLVIGDVGEVMRSVSKNYFLIKSYVKGLDFTPQDSDYAGQMTSLFNVTVEK
jgi:oligopeptide transport system substrate-binding protein